MTRRVLNCCAGLLLVGLLAGCGSRGEVVNKCRLNPQSCSYDGGYEPGEREYAEREAARLNRAESGRLRRSR